MDSILSDDLSGRFLPFDGLQSDPRLQVASVCTNIVFSFSPASRSSSFLFSTCPVSWYNRSSQNEDPGCK
jgi:hypothetical protein